MIIACEGLPGSGKTTVIKLIRKELQTKYGLRVGISDIETVGDAPQLRVITRKYPLGCLSRIILFWLLRLQQYDVIQEMSADCDVVLADRFWGSTLAFDFYGNGVPLEVLQWVGSHIKDYPEITLLFSAPLAVVRKRKDAKTMCNTEFAMRVEKGYKNLAEKMSWVTIDATKEAIQVAEDCIKIILSRLEER